VVIQIKHLQPETRRIANLSPEERLSYLKSDRWIGYTRAQSALSEMSSLLEDQPGRVRPRNMLIIGPSNNGKSTITEKFLRQNPSRVSEGGDHQIISVLSIQMPPDVTSGRFYPIVTEPP
jgi:GTPase SAR1 family protein